LTAIQAEKGKVAYINRRDCQIATDHGFYDEALSVYKKYDQHGMAINVLVEHVVTTDHGLDYAELKNPLVIDSIAA
jgi:clathrin heavy chain